MSEKQKELYKKQSDFFFSKADSLSLANEQLSIKFKTEQKAKRKARFELWTERIGILIAGFLILK